MKNPNYDDIAKLVGIIIHMREPYDSHGDQVAAMSVRLAAALGMNTDEINDVSIGAKLHDIGKIMIRYELLNATRPLTAAERAEMMNHARLGWDIVTKAGYSPAIQQVCLHHHEKWDGSGYPDGLKGDEIPRIVQVVSICDVYDAMSNERPYREALSRDFILVYLKDRRSFDFDPDLVDVFLDKVAASDG